MADSVNTAIADDPVGGADQHAVAAAVEHGSDTSSSLAHHVAAGFVILPIAFAAGSAYSAVCRRRGSGASGRP